MARPLRIEYSGAIYHITVRGNGRGRIFLDDRDRRALCKRLAESVRSYGVRIFLYCLMDNHFHLVLETPTANLRRFMQSALTGYTVSFNLRHRLSGHVTQGRYGARLVGGDDYLYKLSRYVHLNPVQVKNWRVRPLGERLLRLREYPWSSFRAYAGIEPRESWVTYGPMMGLVGKEAGREEASYQVFVEEGLTKPDEDFLQEMEKSPRSIGDEQYREWVDERHAELGESHLVEDVSFRPERPRVEAGEVATRVAGLWGLKAEDLKLSCRGWEGKGILALMLEKYAGLTRRACSPWIGTTTGMSVNYQVSKALRSLDADPKLRKRLSKLEATLEREKGKC